VAKEMKNLVLITSALNTKFGVYTEDQRRQQTLNTIESVRKYIPNAYIVICEMSGVALTDQQVNIFEKNSDQLINFTKDSAVVELYDSTDNWDVVKNVTEVLCFGRALKILKATGVTDNAQRIFKLSGRYVIDERFDFSTYEQYKNKNMIVVGTKKKSQFPKSLTGVDFQYMSRLWSWPAVLNDEIIQVYDSSLAYMYERLAQSGYVDIEHCLYKFLDPNKILETSQLGVTGNIAPNGVAIKD